jgi:hypothetical protein
MSIAFNAVVQSTYRTMTTSMSCAIVATLSLATISLALVVAAVNPAMNGEVVAVVTGLLIVAIASVVTTVSVVIRRTRTTTSNDHLVHR